MKTRVLFHVGVSRQEDRWTRLTGIGRREMQYPPAYIDQQGGLEFVIRESIHVHILRFQL